MRLALGALIACMMTAAARAQPCVDFLLTTEILAESELNTNQVALIRENSKGLIDFEAFLKRPQISAVALGPYGEDGQYNKLIERTGLTSWEVAYQRFGIATGEKNHTEKFMTTLTQSGANIVFFVPPRLWSYDGIYTKKEMWWLLSHPKEMKSVLFVFGAYANRAAQF